MKLSYFAVVKPSLQHGARVFAALVFCGSLAFSADSVDEVAIKLDSFEETINKNVDVRYDISSIDMASRPEAEVSTIRLYRTEAAGTGRPDSDPERHDLAMYYTFTGLDKGFVVIGNYINGMAYFPELGFGVVAYDKASSDALSTALGGVDPLDVKAILAWSSSSKLVQGSKSSLGVSCSGADSCVEVEMDVPRLRTLGLVPADCESMQMVMFFDKEPELLSLYTIMNDAPISRVEFSRSKVSVKEVREMVKSFEASSYEILEMPLSLAISKAHVAYQQVSGE